MFFLLESVALAFMLQKVNAVSEGWRQEENHWYYYNSLDERVTNRWIGSYYVGEDGAWMEHYGEVTGEWVEVENTGINRSSWKFRREDGTYAYGWQLIQGNWYYFDTNGKMLRLTWIDNYYVNENGIMETDAWISSGYATIPFNDFYYVGVDGQWIPEKEYHGEEGQWIEDAKGWRFKRKNGTYPYSDYICIADQWYFFDENGYRVTGSYTSPESGAVYYFHKDGTMARDEVIDGRYYTAWGKWERN